jgi:hypothetical protein
MEVKRGLLRFGDTHYMIVMTLHAQDVEAGSCGARARIANALTDRFSGSHGPRLLGAAHFSPKGGERRMVHGTLNRWQGHALLEPGVLLEGGLQFPQPIASQQRVTAGQDSAKHLSQSVLKLTLLLRGGMAQCAIHSRVEGARVRVQMGRHLGDESRQHRVFDARIGNEQDQNLLDAPVLLTDIARDASETAARGRGHHRAACTYPGLPGAGRAGAPPPRPRTDVLEPLVTAGA